LADFRNVPWIDLETHGGKIFIIDNVAGHKNLKEIEHEDRDILLKVDSYVEYRMNRYNPDSSNIVVHKIIDRVVDEKNNLLLFTESEIKNV